MDVMDQPVALPAPLGTISLLRTIMCRPSSIWQQAAAAAAATKGWHQQRDGSAQGSAVHGATTASCRTHTNYLQMHSGNEANAS
jgi:hypothetical protein